MAEHRGSGRNPDHIRVYQRFAVLGSPSPFFVEKVDLPSFIPNEIFSLGKLPSRGPEDFFRHFEDLTMNWPLTPQDKAQRILEINRSILIRQGAFYFHLNVVLPRGIDVLNVPCLSDRTSDGVFKALAGREPEKSKRRTQVCFPGVIPPDQHIDSDGTELDVQQASEVIDAESF
jgi:hypothetical protein